MIFDCWPILCCVGAMFYIITTLHQSPNLLSQTFPNQTPYRIDPPSHSNAQKDHHTQPYTQQRHYTLPFTPITGSPHFPNKASLNHHTLPVTFDTIHCFGLWPMIPCELYASGDVLFKVIHTAMCVVYVDQLLHAVVLVSHASSNKILKYKLWGSPIFWLAPIPNLFTFAIWKTFSWIMSFWNQCQMQMVHFIHIPNENTWQCRHWVLFLPRCCEIDAISLTGSIKMILILTPGPWNYTHVSFWAQQIFVSKGPQCWEIDVSLSTVSIPMILILTAGSRASVLFVGEGGLSTHFVSYHECTTHTDTTLRFCICKKASAKASFNFPRCWFMASNHKDNRWLKRDQHLINHTGYLMLNFSMRIHPMPGNFSAAQHTCLILWMEKGRL